MRADKQVREQMVECMKGQFDEMIKTELEKTQRLGQLESEVKYLRQALPPTEQGVLGFHPRNVTNQTTPIEPELGAEGV